MSGNRFGGRIEAALHLSGIAQNRAVIDSWQRCEQRFGLAHDTLRRPEIMPESQTRQRRDRSGRLFHHAHDLVRTLYRKIDASGYAVFLTDQDGVILDSVAASSLSPSFRANGLLPGAIWSEEREGTNGIGTCLVEGRPITIHKDEHFLHHHAGLTCTAAPVFDPEGRVCSVLDVSAVRNDIGRDDCLRVRGLVADYANALERSLFFDECGADVIVHLHPDARHVGTSRDALIAIGLDGTIRGATSMARRLLAMAGQDADVSDIFGCDAETLIAGLMDGGFAPHPVQAPAGTGLAMAADGAASHSFPVSDPVSDNASSGNSVSGNRSGHATPDHRIPAPAAQSAARPNMSPDMTPDLADTHLAAAGHDAAPIADGAITPGVADVAGVGGGVFDQTAYAASCPEPNSTPNSSPNLNPNANPGGPGRHTADGRADPDCTGIAAAGAGSGIGADTGSGIGTGIHDQAVHGRKVLPPDGIARVQALSFAGGGVMFGRLTLPEKQRRRFLSLRSANGAGRAGMMPAMAPANAAHGNGAIPGAARGGRKAAASAPMPAAMPAAIPGTIPGATPEGRSGQSGQTGPSEQAGPIARAGQVAGPDGAALPSGIADRDAGILHLYRIGLRLLAGGINVLMAGETGSGKEYMARALHDGAVPGRARPFVAINCAALPETLIESELFGHAGGAFTGAARDGFGGRIRQADGGTLFLDEIGDMSLGAQARLLRVLETRMVEPLGSARAIPVDFRLICASNIDLADAVAQGRFREDLLYRIKGARLALPPLRQRSDFADLANRLLADIASEAGQDGAAPSLAPMVLARLSAHRWPGNLRELRNVLQYASVFAENGVIDLAHLPDDFASAGQTARSEPGSTDDRMQGVDADASDNMVPDNVVTGGGDAVDDASLLAQAEALAVQQALARHCWHIGQTARALGISRNTLYRKMARLSIRRG